MPSNRVPESLIGLSTLLAVAVWAAGLYGTLQIHRYPAAGEWFGFDICGPWGCAARPEALVGYHSFWLMLLTPAALFAGVRLPWQSAIRVAWALSAVGLGLTLAITGWAIIDCLTNGPENLRQYWLPIAGFKLATNTDLPAVQIALAGLTCYASAVTKNWLKPRPPRPSTLPDPGEQSLAAAAGSPGTP